MNRSIGQLYSLLNLVEYPPAATDISLNSLAGSPVVDIGLYSSFVLPDEFIAYPESTLSVGGQGEFTVTVKRDGGLTYGNYADIVYKLDASYGIVSGTSSNESVVTFVSLDDWTGDGGTLRFNFVGNQGEHATIGLVFGTNFNTFCGPVQLSSTMTIDWPL